MQHLYVYIDLSLTLSCTTVAYFCTLEVAFRQVLHTETLSESNLASVSMSVSCPWLYGLFEGLKVVKTLLPLDHVR